MLTNHQIIFIKLSLPYKKKTLNAKSTLGYFLSAEFSMTIKPTSFVGPIQFLGMMCLPILGLKRKPIKIFKKCHFVYFQRQPCTLCDLYYNGHVILQHYMSTCARQEKRENLCATLWVPFTQ